MGRNTYHRPRAWVPSAWGRTLLLHDGLAANGQVPVSLSAQGPQVTLTLSQRTVRPGPATSIGSCGQRPPWAQRFSFRLDGPGGGSCRLNRASHGKTEACWGWDRADRAWPPGRGPSLASRCFSFPRHLAATSPALPFPPLPSFRWFDACS